MPRILVVPMKWQEVDVVDPESGESERRFAMVPDRRFINVCSRQYADGAEYHMGPIEPRSRASHGHYFAALNEAYRNLPENVAARWTSSEHLRKWVLIEVGWCSESEYTMGDLNSALGLIANHLREDPYARITHHKIPDRDHPRFIWHKVIDRRAMSQSITQMGKDSFEKSKKDVLDYVAALVGVETAELRRNAGRSA